MSGEFCDTDVLAYAYDASDPGKQAIAGELVRRLRESGTGRLSVQVLQELYVTLKHKAAVRLPHQEAREIIEDFSKWSVCCPNESDVLEAIDASARWNVSFWDAMLLAAAICAGRTVIWTEYFNAGQKYDGIVARNPFRE